MWGSLLLYMQTAEECQCCRFPYLPNAGIPHSTENAGVCRCDLHSLTDFRVIVSFALNADFDVDDRRKIFRPPASRIVAGFGQRISFA